MDVEVFKASFRLMPAHVLREVLDLYHIASWFARRHDMGWESQAVWERRKALEWAADASLDDRDDITVDT